MIDPKEAYQIGPRGAYQLTNKELQDEARMSQTKRSTGLEAKTAELDAEAQAMRALARRRRPARTRAPSSAETARL